MLNVIQFLIYPLAAIISSLLLDLGIMLLDLGSNCRRIINRNVVRRQCKRCRSENNPEKVNTNSIYFDGKIDCTLQSNGKKLDEEHITIINEPGREYMCHVVSLCHKAEDIYNAIVNSISENLNCLKVISADGTNTNAGHKTGIISRLERKIEQKCHWNVSKFFYTSIKIILYFKYYNKF